MSQQLLLLALSHLDRMTDANCGEAEHYELDHEIEKLLRLMRPADAGYFHGILDVINFARTL